MTGDRVGYSSQQRLSFAKICKSMWVRDSEKRFPAIQVPDQVGIHQPLGSPGYDLAPQEIREKWGNGVRSERFDRPLQRKLDPGEISFPARRWWLPITGRWISSDWSVMEQWPGHGLWLMRLKEGGFADTTPFPPESAQAFADKEEGDRWIELLPLPKIRTVPTLRRIKRRS